MAAGSKRMMPTSWMGSRQTGASSTSSLLLVKTASCFDGPSSTT